MTPAERHALQGLLMTVVETQNIVRSTPGEGAPVDEVVMHDVLLRKQVEQFVDSAYTRELVQLARTLLEAPAANRKTFYGIVTQFDCGTKYRERSLARAPRNDGPIIFEQYLNAHTADLPYMAEKAKSKTDYGWVRIAEIHVEIPEPTPAALPAAAAGVHE